MNPIDNRLHVLILRHPEEPGEELGTASLITDTLANTTLRVGYSWPNFRAALGKSHPLAEGLKPSEWGVLYLGTGAGAAAAKGRRAPEDRLVTLKDGRTPTAKAYGEERSAEVMESLKGIVVLDGTWKQAKTLWWRNPWLLKLRRLILVPKDRSLYGKLRREPRRECLSSLEAVGLTLELLGEKAPVRQSLISRFQEILDGADHSPK